jgi:transposase-like protein
MHAYKRHRSAPDIISHTFPKALCGAALLPYYRCNLSRRDIEDLPAKRGIIVSRESIRYKMGKGQLLDSERPFIEGPKN